MCNTEPLRHDLTYDSTRLFILLAALVPWLFFRCGWLKTSALWGISACQHSAPDSDNL